MTITNPGEAPPLATRPFRKGDVVARKRWGEPMECAGVTYVSETHDYVELRYADGYSFRSRKSEWLRIPGWPQLGCRYVLDPDSERLYHSHACPVPGWCAPCERHYYDEHQHDGA